jgi:hypothetical protein
VQLAESLDVESDDLNDLLDRLEEVRVEDFDFRPEYDQMLGKLREAEKAADPAGKQALLAEAVSLGLVLLGRPQDSGEEVKEIRPEDLTLVAWERLLLNPYSSNAKRAEQVRFPVS